MKNKGSNRVSLTVLLGLVAQLALSSVAFAGDSSGMLLLRYKQFDPLAEQAPLGATTASGFPSRAEDSDNVYIVQFVSQPLNAYRQQIRALGGTIYNYVPNHAYLVRMSPSVRSAVKALPFVRWVGLYEPVYRLEPSLVAQPAQNTLASAPERYNIMVFERGTRQQEAVAEQIENLGGVVYVTNPEGFRMEAALPAEALPQIASQPEVQYIDRSGPDGEDVTTAREIGGANYIEEVGGFTGTGVRGEVMDGGVLTSHVDFQDHPLLIHGVTPPVASHGTATTGIVFGTGAADIRGRGFLPDGQGIAAWSAEASHRYQHTAELLDAPFFAVFQSNSWGGALTTSYTSISAEMDDILLHNDIVILQSQSNTGNQLSRPQAWAKNIVSIGGIRHRGSLDLDDHCWCNAGSIGPAEDGRIKPDLAHFYDMNFTATSSSDTAYTTSFGGTSAATPIVAGHFGLFFEMWHNGLFGNPTGPTVFDSKPHAATAKAIMINTAHQWDFSGLDDDRTRTHQGWGFPDLRNLYDLRKNIFIVDQTDVLANLESKSYEVVVPERGGPLRATLVYKDPMGTPGAKQNTVNDLDLRVTSPSGVIYWGNNGLLEGMWSVPGGKPDPIDTVENVFVQDPEPGTWTVEVIASEINEDEHLETPEIDSDFALVVSGVSK